MNRRTFLKLAPTIPAAVAAVVKTQIDTNVTITKSWALWHPKPLPPGTYTGRLVSSTPNLQNVPKSFRIEGDFGYVNVTRTVFYPYSQ